MALKSLLFVFAFVLLVSTTMVTSTEEDAIETERRRHHHHHHHHHEKPPMKVQTYPQPKAPAYPPKPAHHYVKCDRRCEEYCKKKEHEKKECERICGHCCREYKCVPGPYDKCAAWDKVRYHDKWVECPKY